MKKYYGPQTDKAISNFPFSFRSLPKEFMYAIAEIKKSAALAHAETGELSRERAKAIVKACDEIIAGEHNEQFFLPAFQGGAGTSNHMNMNEVVAARANEILGKNMVHANDHVNMSHSTNDVMPSALRISAIRKTHALLLTTDMLVRTFEKKAKEFSHIRKLGRTHMQDAVPITLGDEFRSFADQVKRSREKVDYAHAFLLELNLGGSAVGNSINASPKYISRLYQELKKVTKLPLCPAKNMMAETSSDSDFVSLSQALTLLAMDLSKIANDLRLLSSGPKGGFGEIILPELQPGSSIMPGKVNPILPEAVNQLYFLVAGNNLTIEHAAHGAQLELGVMLPVMTDRLLESLTLMEELLRTFAVNCIAGIKANVERCKENLEKSTAYATLLNPIIGYDNAAAAVKEAIKTGKTLREVVLEKKLLTSKEFDKLINR